MSSIASSSNTSNPTVMLTAGLMAKKAVEIGLSIPKFVKRSLCPGSGVVTSYLQVCFNFHCDNMLFNFDILLYFVMMVSITEKREKRF